MIRVSPYSDLPYGVQNSPKSKPDEFDWAFILVFSRPTSIRFTDDSEGLIKVKAFRLNPDAVDTREARA